MRHIYEQPEFGENWFDYASVYQKFIAEIPDNGHFIEIGSWKGKSAAFMAVEIANSNKRIKFDCIDTWMGSEEHQNNPEIQSNSLYDMFLENIEPIKSLMNPIRLTSQEASKLYNKESIDIVFIDACHRYECVKEDISLWLPKIKNVGILAGHDYTMSWPEVMQAVDETLGKDTIQVRNSCWIYQKSNS